MLFIDLDKLKRINDTYGHDAGDRAVSAVGTIIRDAIRIDRREDFLYRADIDDDYSISRHGGDEFLVALELQEPSALDIVATRIKQRVGDTDEQRARGYMAPLPVSVSIGGVAYEVPEAPPSLAAQALGKALIAVADEQMYESKKDGYVHLATARYDGALEVDRRRRAHRRLDRYVRYVRYAGTQGTSAPVRRLLYPRTLRTRPTGVTDPALFLGGEPQDPAGRAPLLSLSGDGQHVERAVGSLAHVANALTPAADR